MPRRKRSLANRIRSHFRSVLQHECLEQRNLFAVTSQLLGGGVLDISMDADRDSAEVRIDGSELVISSDTRDSFAFSEIRSIQVSSRSGKQQSISFSDTLSIPGSLGVQGMQSVHFASGTYTLGSVAVVASESIDFSRFELRATGDIALKAQQTVTSVESGLLGFLGAVSQASTSIRVIDSGLFGGRIELLAATTINANADGDDDEDVNRDFARIKSVGRSEIVLAGNTVLESASDLQIQSSTVQTTRASAAALSSSLIASRDAALAINNVTSESLITLSDTYRFLANGNLSIIANNQVTLTTNADGSLSGPNGKGGIVAWSDLLGTTKVLFEGQGSLSGSNITTQANSQSSITTTAKSSSGGATANDASTQSDLLNNDTQTSSGGLGLAAAYARTKTSQATEVIVSGTLSLTANRDVELHSNASSAATTSANGGSTSTGGDSGSGVGVAIALDRSTETNRVSMGGTIAVRASNFLVHADTNGGSQHTTSAVSGVGASNVGGAGAFASNKVANETQVALGSEASLNQGATAIQMSAISRPTLVADAKPTVTSDRTAKNGIGASIARNKLTQTTDASIAAKSTLLGNGALQSNALSQETITTTSTTGAEGGSSINAGVGIAVVDSNVSSTIGSGNALNLTGPVQIIANRTGTIATTVDGTTVGQTAARGGSFALNDVQSQVLAQVDRSIHSTGNVDILSDNAGSIVANAKASVQGTGTSNSTSDQQTSAEQQAGGSDQLAPSADALGKVSLGAATAINLLEIQASSKALSQAQLQSGGSITLRSSNPTDSSTKADASAVGAGTTTGDTTTGGTEKGRAVAVSINKASVRSETLAANSSSLQATNGVTLDSNTGSGSDVQHAFSAEAISGAGSRKTGFAGSFALNRVDNAATSQTEGASLHVGTGALRILATNTATHTAKATPSVAVTGQERGIGASFAINVANNETIASAGTGTTLTSNTNPSAPPRSEIKALSNQTSVTESKGGSGSEDSDSRRTLTSVFGIQSITNTTESKLDAVNSNLNGSLNVLSQLTANETLLAEGQSTGAEKARGLVVAFDMGNNQTHSTLHGSLTTPGSVATQSHANEQQTIQGKAASKGGDVTPTEGSADKDVADAKKIAIDQGATDNGEEPSELKTPDGSVAFAAALAIGITKSSTTSQIADGTFVNANDSVAVLSSQFTNANVKADATAVTVDAAEEEATSGTDESDNADPNDARGRGVGVAIALHIQKTDTSSTIGANANVHGTSLTVNAGTPPLSKNTFTTEAVSGAGGGEVGTAGSLAIDVLHNRVDARVKAASIDVDSGALKVEANQRSDSNNLAQPSSNATGSKRGRGASVAVQVVHNSTYAEVEDNAVVRDRSIPSQAGAGNVSVKANSLNNTSTVAKGGAGAEEDTGEAATTFVTSLARVVNDTQARLSSTSTGTSHVAGNIEVSADHSGTTTTTAEGDSRAEKTAVGLVFGLGFVKDSANADVAGHIVSDGNLSVRSNNQAVVQGNAKASARGGEADKKTGANGKGDISVKTSSSKNLLESTDGNQAIDEDTPDPTTPDGSMSLAGSLAINFGRVQSSASIADQSNLHVDGTVTVQSLNRSTVQAKSDASAVAIPANENNQVQNGGQNSNNQTPTRPDPSQTGVGVAIAVNAARVKTEALIGGSAHVHASALVVDAGTNGSGDQDHQFSSQSISGTGVDKIGFAGSFAIQSVENDSLAAIRNSAEIELSPSTNPSLPSIAQNLSVTSRNETTSQAKADASVAGSPKTGIGPSIVINASQNSSHAEITGSTFVGTIHDLTVDAQGDYGSHTRAETGVTSKPTLQGEGGLAISPALAVGAHRTSTVASAGENAQSIPADLTGNLHVHSTHTSSSITSAESIINASGNAAIGTPVAVNFARDESKALASGVFDVAGDASVQATSDIDAIGGAQATQNGSRAGSGEAKTIQDRAQSWAQGFRREPGEPREKILDRLEDRLTEVGDKLQELSEAKMETTGVAAAGVANVVLSETIADVQGSIHALGKVDVIAESDRDITALADGLAVAPTNETSYGGALALNIAEQTIQARAYSDDGLSGRQITVRASNVDGNSHSLRARALAGGGAKDDGVAGSIALNFSSDTIEASVGKSPIGDGLLTMDVEAQQGIQIVAHSNLELQNVAGAGAIGIQADGKGGALAVNFIKNETLATTGANTTLNTGGVIAIDADSQITPVHDDIVGNPIALAAGGAGGGDQARAGAVALNIVEETTVASLGSNNDVNATTVTGPRGIPLPGSVSIQANSDSELNTGAGAMSLGLKLGRSVGVALNFIDRDVYATIGDDSTITTSGNVSVQSDVNQDYFSIAAAPGFGGSVNKPNFGGAIQVISQIQDASASLGDTVTIHSAGNVSIDSHSNVNVDGIAGSVAGAQNQSVAGSLNIISLLDHTESSVGANSSVETAGNIGLTVEATSQQQVLPIAVGGSGAGSSSTAGSINFVHIDSSTLAHVDDNTTILARNATSPGSTRPGITIHSQSDLDLNTTAGVVSGAGKKGFGGALDTVLIDKETRSYVGSGTHLDSDQNISVTADSSEDILSLGASVGGSGSTSVLGSLSGYSVDVLTQAVLGDAPNDQSIPTVLSTAHAKGSVLVHANDSNEMDFVAGGAGASGGNAAGGAATINSVHKQTEARIAELAEVDAEASAQVAALSIKNGQFGIQFANIPFDSQRAAPPTIGSKDLDGDGSNDLSDSSLSHPRVATPSTENRRGVIVTATNADDIAEVVAGAGIGAEFAVGISTPATIMDVATTAEIANQAKINTKQQNLASSNQSVLVAAGTDLSHLSISGALSIGGSGAISPAGNVESSKLQTHARIGDQAVVAAKQNIDVRANTSEDTLMITAAGSGGGSFGGSGSVAVYKLENETLASIGSAADIDANGNVVVLASDISDLDNIAGSAGIGFGGGVGISLGVNAIHKDTRAFIQSDASVDAKANAAAIPVLSEVGTSGLSTTTAQGIIVQAYSSESLLNVAAAGSAGAGTGAGSLSVNVIDSDTTAFVGDRATLNAAAGGINSNQSVHILAGNEVKARSISGGLAVGGSSFAGSGDIGVVRNDTATFIGSDAHVHALNDIVVHSLAKEDVDSLGVSGGFAATAAFAAAASVWTLGTQLDTTYSDDTTTTNALQNGNTTVDQQAVSRAGTSRNALISSLNNYQGVTAAPATNPTPSQQMADQLRANRQSLSNRVPSASQLSSDLLDPSDATGTTTEVRSGAILDAGDDISILADSTLELSSITGSTAGAAAFALGAAVTVQRTHMNTDALFSGVVDRADQVLIHSQSTNSTIGRDFSANGSIGGALGAGVVSVKDTGTTTARIDGNIDHHASIEQANQLKVEAISGTSLEAVTGQGSIAGVAAAGVTVTKAVAEGTTQAILNDYVDVGQIAGQSVGSMVMNATSLTNTRAQGIAIQAGIGGAGGLNFATAENHPTVGASMGSTTQDSHSSIQVVGSIDIDSTSHSNASAEMLGLQLAAGASLGFSRARATNDPVVAAAIGASTTVAAGGDVTVDAILNRPQIINLPFGGTVEVVRGAFATAESGGAAAIAGNTARSIAESTPDLSAKIFGNATISTPGLVHVATESNNNADAQAGAITGGLVSAGGVQTTTTLQGTAHSAVLSGSDIQAGSVEVLSTAIDRGVSIGTAATGGIISGNGVTSSANLLPNSGPGRFGATEDIPNVSVEVIGATIDATGNVTVRSKQIADVDAYAKGLAIGGVFTAGKSDANVTVKPLLDTKVSSSTLTAGATVLIESRMGDASNPSVKAMNIEEEQAVAKDEVSTAFSKGSGGALVGLIGSSSDTIFKPVVDSHVHQSQIAANDVTILSEDDSSAVAIARNFGAGLVARGQANATLDMKDDLSVSVGGTSESGRTTIDANHNFSLKSESDLDGDAFSNTRAIAGFPTGRATTTIHGDFDLSASIGDFVDVQANNLVLIEAQAEQAQYGSQQSTDPDDPTNLFGRPNFFGANAHSDTGGLSSNALATSTTTLGTSNTPAVALVQVGSFSSIASPSVTMHADVQGIQLKSDASARSAGALVDVSSTSTGEVHSFTRVDLNSDSSIDATNVELQALNGSNSIQAEVESTTDKDGIDTNPKASGTIRMDTDSTIDAADRFLIHTRNLDVLADTNVTQFDLFVKENDTNRAGTGTRVSSFIRDRSIHWDADLKLKGAASPTLIVDQDQAGNAVVTTANGVSIQDTDATTLGNVAAANIVVNSINNNAAYGNVHIEIPRRGAPADDTGVVDGNLGSVTVERGFDEVNLINRSSKPMTVNNIQVFNMSTPNIVVDAPDSSVLSFPVFHDFGDTHVNVQNAIKTAPAPALTLNGIIQNPVGETEVQAGAIIKSGTGKIVTNVANLSSTVGNIGSGTRLPIEIVLSDGRQEVLFVNSAGSVSLDLVARQRQATGTPPATIDVSGIQAVSTNNVLYHTTLMENSLPNTLPLLRVNEIQESDITDVVSFFETPEEILNLDLGALGTGATALVPSTWDHDLVKGSAITLALDSTQIDGPLMNITGNTDVGSSNTNISTNGNIVLTEVAGAMRIGAITTTRGDVVLNSSNAILASPSDTAADVIGSSVTLNAATTIGSTTAPVDVDSGNRLHASASGDIVLVETSGNINIGRIATTGGNVVLTATTGSFLDADADIAADIVGQGLTLTANNSTTTPSPSIGTSSNPIEIDSTGVVRAIARGDIQLVETSGSLTLAEARSTQGNIRVDVLDQSTSGNDLTLNAAQVIANAGSVQLNAGDNLTASAGTLIQGTLIGMVSDFGDADPGVGTTVQLSGTFVGRPITLATGNDVDNVTLSQATFQGQTNLSLGAGNDSLTLDRLAPLTTTNAGVRDTLAVNLGTGAHSVQMISSPTGNIIVPITATRGTGLNTLTVQDTTSNDAFALNASQLGITRPGTSISELLTFGATFDRVDIQASEGNDALGVDLSGGNLNFANGVAFAGGNGTDQVTVNGSSLADFFEVDATSSTSGTLRTQVNNGTMSAPTTLTSVEQVGINGQSPTSNPGDRLRILDSVSGIPTIPSGSLVTPLPVSYTNIEQVLVGGIPAATNDSFTIQEDTNGSFNLFANDLGLTDTPLTVSVVQPTFGTVVYNNGGTPLQISDDRFQFTPRAHFSGTTSFQYTVVDANGESSTATASITIEPIADAPIVSAQKATGSEGVPIPLKVDAKLVDTDGSETLQVSMRQVPSIAFFVDGKGNEVGVNQGGGVWNLTAVNLSDLYLVVKDNGNFPLVMIATSSDSGKSSAISSVTFDVEVTNVAPNATIMSSPTDATKDTTVTVQMAATDPSTIDKEAGFLYSINWGDGTAIQTVQGAPGVPPSVDHIYTANGTYTITISATDKDGGVGPTTSQVIRIGQSGIVPDPLRPGQSMLVLLGSDANDDIRITRQGNGNQGRLFVYRNNELTEKYPIPSSRILVQGYAGDDTIIVDANVSTDTWLFGSLGDDILIGGSGNNVLLGSDGDDQLRSRQGLDILFGGAGRDFLFGGSDDDILHAGTSVYDLSDAALFAIQQEWLRPLDVETRVAHLKGTLAGGLNGSRFLIGSGPNQTAFDDGVRDLIDNHRTKDFVLANTDQAIRDLFNPTELFEELDGSSGSSGSSFGKGESQEESNELALFTPFFLDVDGNGQVSPLDALLILNWLNTHRTLSQETDTDWLLDTDSDQRLSPRDALVVINHLNKMSHASYQPEGETEDLTDPSQQIGSAFDGSFLSDLDVKKRNTR